MIDQNFRLQPNQVTSTDTDDDDSILNTVVDNCCSTNYATINLDDEEIQKYFVNISSNFSRNSSVRRSVRNFNKSSNSNTETPTKFGMSSSSSARSRRTTPASSARASPYIFDQFTNTVACLKPAIPTYYSESSCSSRASTLSRNRSNTGSIHSMNHIGSKNYGGAMGFDPNRLRKALSSKINIDNVAYYQSSGANGNRKTGSKTSGANGNESPSKIKWNFLGDLKKAQAQAAEEERKKRFQHRKLYKSAQNVNNVSIWCAENDERNAIIFHHESGIVENCSSNYLNFFATPELPLAKSADNISKPPPPMNNTLEGPSKLSGSLQNMQRNIFSRSSSNIYNVSSDFKIFEKQSNLYRNSVNLSQNYPSSLSSSLSSLNLEGASNRNPNLKSKVLNATREWNRSQELRYAQTYNPQGHMYCSQDQGLELESYNLTSSNSTENIQ